MVERVLIITTEYPPDIGGGGMFAHYLSHALSHFDIETHVLIGRRGKALPLQSDSDNLFFHQVRVKTNPGVCTSISLLDSALRICREDKPDVIHGNHFDGTIVGACAKHSFQKPLVSTLHKTPLLFFPRDIVRRRAYYSFLNWIRTLNVDRFVAGSQAFRKELRVLGLSEAKIALIPHGIPVSSIKFRVKSATVPSVLSEKVVIACLSRLDRRKRLELFVRACALAKKSLPRNRFLFLITGEDLTRSEKEYRNEIEHLAKQNGIKVGSELQFRKFSLAEMPSLYKSARVMVLPSEREGLGLAILESMAAGVPVVASNTVGIREVISDGKNGLLFNPGDEDDLACQMIRIFSEERLREELIKEGLATVKRKFNSTIMGESYLKLYNEVAGQ